MPAIPELHDIDDLRAAVLSHLPAKGGIRPKVLQTLAAKTLHPGRKLVLVPHLQIMRALRTLESAHAAKMNSWGLWLKTKAKTK